VQDFVVPLKYKIGDTIMLARQYDSYAWNVDDIDVTPQPIKIKHINYRIFRHQIIALFVVGILCYLGSVMLSEVYVSKTSALVNMKHEEQQLLTKNEALKIDVDRLSNPARIAGLATTKLGMSTARSNIYVQADGKKIAYDGYAYAK